MARRRKKLVTAYDRSFAFFKEHGGSYRNRGERRAVGPRRVGRNLARAEREMRRRGWYVEWTYDEMEWDPGDTDYVPNEVFIATLYDANGEVLDSLAGIADPDANYRRVVEAELAYAALPARRNR